MKDFKYDKFKSLSEQTAALKETCSSPGCDNHLSLYSGPGSSKYCRTHQLELSEYGGYARSSKPYSMGKTSVCEECETDVLQLEKVKAVTDPTTLNRLVRSLIQTDHIDGNHDNNDADNLRHICVVCHTIKTTIEQDYL